MDAIKEIINGILQDLQKKKDNSLFNNPEVLLKKILTKRELQHIKFNYFRKGILGITVDSSGWIYHLSLKKDYLLAELRKNLAELKDVRLRLGETDE